MFGLSSGNCLPIIGLHLPVDDPGHLRRRVRLSLFRTLIIDARCKGEDMKTVRLEIELVIPDEVDISWIPRKPIIGSSWTGLAFLALLRLSGDGLRREEHGSP